MKGIQGCTRRKYVKPTSRIFSVLPMRSRMSDDTWKCILGISIKLRRNTSLSRKYTGGKVELPRGIKMLDRYSTSEGIGIESPVCTVATWSWMRFGYSQFLSSLRSHISHVCTCHRKERLVSYLTHAMQCGRTLSHFLFRCLQLEQTRRASFPLLFAPGLSMSCQSG